MTVRDPMSLEPIRAYFIHFHPPTQALADVDFVAGRAATEVSDVVLARICNAFRAAVKRQGVPSPASVWTDIGESYHPKFVAALLKRDLRTVRSMFESLFHGTLTFGVDQWQAQVDAWNANPSLLAAEGARCKDLLLRLAEAVGSARVENPEQSPWGWAIHDAEVHSLVTAIERKAGVSLVNQEVADGRFGLRTERGLLSQRDLYSAHGAYRVKEVLDSVLGARYSPKDVRVGEIGGGIGRVILYLHRLGFRDLTIVDLPVLNALQAFYLAGNGLESSLRLCGEPTAPGASIRISPAGAESLASSGPFDLVVNQDSLPEMGAATATEYLTAMRDGAARLLLSQNHESAAQLTSSSVHAVVAQLAERIGGFRRIARHPWWMRRGYVDEVFAIGDADRMRG